MRKDMKGACAECGKYGRIGDGPKDTLKIDKNGKPGRVICRGTHQDVPKAAKVLSGWKE